MSQKKNPKRPERRSRLLSTSLLVVTCLIGAQAAFAGLFLSGTGAGRALHLWTGSALPYVGLVPAVAVWGRAEAGIVSRRFAGAVTALVAALWIQDALGHMPFAVTTAIHIPLGVALFGATLMTALEARRRGV